MLINLNNVRLSYADHEVLGGISLRISRGEKICIIGPSGCGKTSLLNVISGVQKPTSGMAFNNYDRLSYVFQEDRLLPWKTVRENIRIVNPGAEDMEIRNIIRLVGLEGFENHLPSELSGGMRQRTSIARGFFFPAGLLLMDEPLKSLDYCLRMNLVENILQLTGETDRTLLYVTHEIDEALMLADRILVLTRCPAIVSEELQIHTPQTLRDLSDHEMTVNRNRIIRLLKGYHEPPYFQSARQPIPEKGFKHTTVPAPSVRSGYTPHRHHSAHRRSASPS